MGCMPQKITTSISTPGKVVRSALTFQSIQHKALTSKGKGKMSDSCIPKACWMKIVDYLNYSDIKEAGKVNRKLNSLSKQSQILVKFFKKKDTSNTNTIWRTNKCLLLSFSHLQRSDSLNSDSSHYSTSDEMKVC